MTLAVVRLEQARELVAALAIDLHMNERPDLACIAEYVEWLLGEARSQTDDLRRPADVYEQAARNSMNATRYDSTCADTLREFIKREES